MSGTLYLCATPIGNLEDITLRVLRTLQEVDVIAAEDTRNTIKLLNHFEIKTPMTSYHEYNKVDKAAYLVEQLANGKNIALVTDAGTPAISDPGEELVALCAQSQVQVEAIPGPCALITALSVSGLPTGRFIFEGFLPMNRKNRRARLEELRNEERTMVFYEAPHKLTATLDDLRDTFGPDRRVAVCRELTKLHEQVLRTTLGEATDYFVQTPPRGEFVLVVDGAPTPAAQAGDPQQALKRVEQLRGEGWSLKDAAAQAAVEFGLKKRALYDLSLGK